MNCAREAWRLLALSLGMLFGVMSQTHADEPDLSFDAKVAQPAYRDRHPSVLLDGAHWNYHALGGAANRFKPFANLVISDGYRVTPNRQKFTKAVLGPYEILVIGNAMGGAQRLTAEAARPALTAEECNAVRDWVQAGGSLLLVAEQHPFGAAARELARRFNVEMSDGTVSDTVNSDADDFSDLIFTRENGLLGDHPITRGTKKEESLSQVLSFTGQSLKGPAGSEAFLKLSDTAVDQQIGGVTGQEEPAKGRAQGLALTLGQGRVVILGDASLITAVVDGKPGKPEGMNVSGNDDRQLALNIMHWLSRLPASEVVAAKPDASAPATATAPAPAAGETRSAAEIAQESEPSIALVKGRGSFGTGFLVAKGILATNAHVIEDEFISEIAVHFPSAEASKKGPFKAELLYEDEKRDLAILAVKTDLPPVRVAPSYTFRKGEDITAIGNPGLGEEAVLENAISRGLMSTKTTLEGQKFYQLGISVNPGNSGGPVFDSQGQVIGVVTLKSAKQEGVAFSIPVEDLNEAIEKQAKQPTSEAGRAGSQHRSRVAVRVLGSLGALYCLGIDVKRVANSPLGRGDASIREAAAKFDEVLATIKKEVVPVLDKQVAGLGKDQLVAPSVRDKVGKLSISFNKLKATYDGNGSGFTPAAFKQMKTTHRQLMTDLYNRLKLTLPDKLMVAFEDRPLPQPSVILSVVPPSRASTLRQRVQERRDAMEERRDALRGSASSRLRSRPGINRPPFPGR